MVHLTPEIILCVIPALGEVLIWCVDLKLN